MAIHTVRSRPLYFSALRLSLYPPPWPDPRKIERTKENKKERHTKSPIKRRLPMYSSESSSVPGVPTPIPHSRCLPQPASGPAFPHPWRRRCSRSPGCISRLGPVRAPPALSGASSSTPGICQYSNDRLSVGNAPGFAFPFTVCR